MTAYQNIKQYGKLLFLTGILYLSGCLSARQFVIKGKVDETKKFNEGLQTSVSNYQVKEVNKTTWESESFKYGKTIEA
jgi:hypothetical protein